MTQDQFEEYDEEEQAFSWKKALKSVGLPLVMTLFVFWYYPDTYACTAQAGVLDTCWPLWQLWTIIFFTGWWSMMAFEKDLKLGTMKIVWSDGHTTSTGRPYHAGDFTIYRAGGLRWMGFEKEGGEGLVIAHKTAINKLGRQTAITAKLNPTQFRELPKAVRDTITALGFVKYKPYRFGLVDPQKYLLKLKAGETIDNMKFGKLDELKPEEFQVLYKETNKISKAFETLHKKSLDKLEQQASQISRIGVSDSLWSNVVNRLNKDENPNKEN